LGAVGVEIADRIVTRERMGEKRRQGCVSLARTPKKWHGEEVEGPRPIWIGRAAAFLWSGDD
jgi:hypothetical protein